MVSWIWDRCRRFRPCTNTKVRIDARVRRQAEFAYHGVTESEPAGAGGPEVPRCTLIWQQGFAKASSVKDAQGP